MRLAVKLLALAFTLYVGNYLVGCDGDGDGTGPGPTIASITITPANDTLTALGATVLLSATARDAGGNVISGVSFTWDSNASGVASVTSAGLVTAVDNGNAVITATAQGVTGLANIRVAQEVSTVQVTPAMVDSLIGVDDTVRFVAAGLDANANPVAAATFTWMSSDMGVATVDNMGLVTVVANGTSMITAEESGGVTGTATFKSATVMATLDMQFNYTVTQNPNSPHHPLSITSDGSFYYVIADGSQPSPISRHDLAGNFVDSTTTAIDARAMLYNPADSKFYLKPFGTDWYEIDPANGNLTLALSGIFANAQSSPAITPDGTTILEHNSGTVRFLNATTGTETASYNVQTGVFPADVAVATDGNYFFTWDATTAYMYDMVGRLVTSFNIPTGSYGFSLSYANGMLWTTDDLNSGDTGGTWYGYDLMQQ